MTAYSQLSDAELVRKVQELMGWNVVPFVGGLPYNFALHTPGGEFEGWGDDEAEAWCHAPSPLKDANVCMGLVGEMWKDDCMVQITFGNGHITIEVNKRVGSGYDELGTAYHYRNPARAICEVYCMVKEGKK